MSAPFLDAIDWQRPWLAPFRTSAAPLVQADDWRATLNAMVSERGLRNHRGLPIHFVPQASLPPQTPYEAFISATGGVPTRENLHDFFNALMWLTFPRIKVQLNALQAAEIERNAALARNGQTRQTKEVCRGAMRDAATIFDENAALFVASDQEWCELLRSHSWYELFVARREAFARNCQVQLFGHALLEKLTTPYKAITAHCWIVVAGNAFFDLSPSERIAWLDAEISGRLANGLTTADFSPLPVLGLPQWWDGQDDEFYADTKVFRPKRRMQESRR